MGVKLLNECSHKINRAPGHSSSPRQKMTASRKEKKKSQESRKRPAELQVWKDVRPLEPGWMLGSQPSRQFVSAHPLTRLGMKVAFLSWSRNSFPLHEMVISKLENSQHTLQPSSPKCPYPLPMGSIPEMKRLCSIHQRMMGVVSTILEKTTTFKCTKSFPVSQLVRSTVRTQYKTL